MDIKKKYKLIIVHSFGKDETIKAEVVKRAVSQGCKNMDIMILDDVQHRDMCSYIRKEEADLLLTFDLTGFDRSTLAGGIAYNLLPCKQIHIITKEHLPNEKYLSKQLSISMFFYCVGLEVYNHLSEKYPDMPYLKVVEGWIKEDEDMIAQKNADALCEIILEVMHICHME